MITLHELLEDPVYKKFFTSQPAVPEHLKEVENWRLWVKINGKWKYKNFLTYTMAFKYLKKILEKVQDAAICSPGYSFDPPNRIVKIKGKYVKDSQGKKVQVTKMVTWKPKLDPLDGDHHWCTFCRRPTIFQRFKRHHALLPSKLGGSGIDSTLLRCTICGASENIVNLKRY